MDNQTLPSKHNEPSSLKYDLIKTLRRNAARKSELDADKSLLIKAANEIVRLSIHNALLLAALQMLHDDIAEYASINNLGGFDNHAMRMARAAIAKANGDA